MIVDAGALVLNVLVYRMIDGSLKGKTPVQNQTAAYELENLFVLVQSALMIATAVAFCIWTFQAYKNLTRLRVRGLKHSPGWAVGYFFIPILNWFKPCVVFVEMWRASAPTAAADDPTAWQRTNGASLVGLWWICWIASRILGNCSARLSFPPANPSLQELQTQSGVAILCDALSILAALFAILLVKRIQDRQAQKYLRVLAAESSYLAERLTPTKIHLRDATKMESNG
jgi:hypothetical protein